MRILLVTHFFPPNHLGGTEVLTQGLAQALQAKGHTVQVICAEAWETAPSYTIQYTDDIVQGIPVRRSMRRSRSFRLDISFQETSALLYQTSK